MSTPLFMIRLALDAQRLFTLGRTQKLPPHQVDLGYLVHCQLSSLFGMSTLKPFSVLEEAGRWISVLAYTEKSKEELIEKAKTFADPAAYDACNWETFSQKPMPSAWAAGQRFGFRVKVAPVVRLAKAFAHPGGELVQKGAEVDAFLARCWHEAKETQVSREEVYQRWFSDQLARRGGATPDRVSLEGFQRERLLRRLQGEERKAHIIEAPAATLTGTLAVTEPSQFTELLRGGVGRHRAFGFGMVLLSPARE